MASDDRDDGRHLAPVRVIHGEVVGGRGYDDAVRERCYALWSTLAAMNARATARWYASEVEPGDPAPTAETIRQWAIAGDWMARRADDYRRNHGQRLFDLQLRYFAIMEAHVEVMAQAQAGAWDDNPAAGIVRLKPGELAGRIIERGIVPLMPAVPQVESRDWERLSLEERESLMRGELQQRKGKSG